MIHHELETQDAAVEKVRFRDLSSLDVGYGSMDFHERYLPELGLCTLTRSIRKRRLVRETWEGDAVRAFFGARLATRPMDYARKARKTRVTVTLLYHSHILALH